MSLLPIRILLFARFPLLTGISMSFLSNLWLQGPMWVNKQRDLLCSYINEGMDSNQEWQRDSEERCRIKSWSLFSFLKLLQGSSWIWLKETNTVDAAKEWYRVEKNELRQFNIRQTCSDSISTVKRTNTHLIVALLGENWKQEEKKMILTSSCLRAFQNSKINPQILET